MMHLGWAVTMAFCVSAFLGCGGSDKRQVEAPDNGQQTEDPASNDDVLIPEEKFEEIQRLFERKTTTIGRCFVEALDAGEVGKRDKVLVTVSTTISEAGAPTNTRVLKASTASQVMRSCVVRYVSGWEFPTLPKPIEYSHVYKFEEF